ncbi:MAG TPA: hypothetical protein VFF06_13810 [Polyangia bacterium]|nr:hypothetical protein [Polyangia bacterium]
MTRALALVGLCAGCSLTFDDDPRFLPLTGSPPSASALQLIDEPSGHTLQVMTGPDGVAWAALFDPSATAEVRVVRLADPVREVRYRALAALVMAHHLYLSDGATLHVVNPGDDARSGNVPVPPFPGSIVPNDADNAFLYVGDAAFVAFRSDLTSERFFALDASIGGATRLPLLASDGEWVFTLEPDGTVVAHSMRFPTDFAIGTWLDDPKPDERVIVDDTAHALVFCDARGLVVEPYEVVGQHLIDPKCTTLPDDVLPLARGGLVYYRSDAVTTKVAPLDGSEPPTTLPAGAHRVWTPVRSSLAYSLDPAGRFSGDAGDGWVGDWRFMQRGLDVQFSAGGLALRWLELAADDSHAGDLTLARELGSLPLLLARNVTEFDELSDGRVIAEANHAYDHEANRVIVIDRDSRGARWVADGVKRYTLIPGSDAILGELVGDGDLRLVRFPIPSP